MHQIKLSDVMTPSPEALSLNDDVAYAVNLMATGSLRSIPIVGDGGELVAVLTAADVLGHLTRVFDNDRDPASAGNDWFDVGGEG